MRNNRQRSRGFTLIEILIVVILLGILAAIVIPQFNSASSQARTNAGQSIVQSLRSQIQLYRIQHGNALPDLVTDWSPMVQTSTYGNPPQTLGPYVQPTVNNPLTGGNVVKNGDGTAAVAGADFIYDYNGGNGTGNIWATTNTAAGTLLQ